MKIIELKLTPQQALNFEKITALVEETTAFLDSLPQEERLEWQKKCQYPYPIGFGREIGGTVYTVNAHFSSNTAETVEGKVKRILGTNIAH